MILVTAIDSAVEQAVGLVGYGHDHDHELHRPLDPAGTLLALEKTTKEHRHTQKKKKREFLLPTQVASPGNQKRKNESRLPSFSLCLFPLVLLAFASPTHPTPAAPTFTHTGTHTPSTPTPLSFFLFTE